MMSKQINELISTILEALNHMKANPEDSGYMIDGVIEAVGAIAAQLNSSENDVPAGSDLHAFQSDINYMKSAFYKLQSTLDEVLWANIFNNTINGSTFLKEKSFSPGRWAAGYPCLYIIYRVLRDAKPKRILELGLGETTRVISQYSRENNDVEHIIVEHDPEWISFFSKSFQTGDNTKFLQLPWAYVQYKDAPGVRVFKDFYEKTATAKYDFIVIDAPLGGDMSRYARIDCLALLPEHLAESFVIIVDDFNRATEKNMVRDMLEIFKNAGIAYANYIYSGENQTYIVCSTDLKFLVSL